MSFYQSATVRLSPSPDLKRIQVPSIKISATHLLRFDSNLKEIYSIYFMISTLNVLTESEFLRVAVISHLVTSDAVATIVKRGSHCQHNQCWCRFLHDDIFRLVWHSCCQKSCLLSLSTNSKCCVDLYRHRFIYFLLFKYGTLEMLVVVIVIQKLTVSFINDITFLFSTNYSWVILYIHVSLNVHSFLTYLLTYKFKAKLLVNFLLHQSNKNMGMFASTYSLSSAQSAIQHCPSCWWNDKCRPHRSIPRLPPELSPDEAKENKSYRIGLL